MITVVIPTLGNRIELINSALDSVNSQSCKPREILVINNGSKSILESLVSTEVVLREFLIPNRAGVSQARNFGASLSTTPYISFLDDDDFWHIDYLKNITSKIQSSPDIILSRLDKFFPDHTRVPFMNATDRLSISDFLLFNPGATGSNTTVLKTSFFDLGGFDPKLPPAEDSALVLDALLMGLSVVVESNAISYMRIHSGDRLTDAKFAIRGYREFLKKYRGKMTFRTQVFNLWRIYREESKIPKVVISKIIYLVLSFAIITLRVTPKSIWHPESIKD